MTDSEFLRYCNSIYS